MITHGYSILVRAVRRDVWRGAVSLAIVHFGVLIKCAVTERYISASSPCGGGPEEGVLQAHMIQDAGEASQIQKMVTRWQRLV